MTARDIAQQYASDGLEIDPKCILLEEPIRELGIYKVRIRLHSEVECEAKVWVVKGDDNQTVAGRRATSTGDDESFDEDDSEEVELDGNAG